MKSDGLSTYSVCVDESDLFISSTRQCVSKAYRALLEVRMELTGVISQYPPFKTSLSPFIPEGDIGSDTIRDMVRAGISCGVGPMASVAGAVAEYVGGALKSEGGDVIIENGGDIFLSVSSKRTVGTFAGSSDFSNMTFFEVDSTCSPLGICTSSGTVGHSLSFGRADAVTIISRSATLADAAATAVCNVVKRPGDIDSALKKARTIEGVEGAVVMMGESLGVWGALKIKKMERSNGITFCIVDLQ